LTHKKVDNADAGTLDKFGGNDLDKWSDFASGVDVDDYDINCDFKLRQDKLSISNSANTFQTKLRTAATAARTLTIPDSAHQIVTRPSTALHRMYYVHQSGGVTYVTDKFGKIIQQDASTAVAVQAQLDTIANNQTQDYYWDADVFTLEEPIVLPFITGTAVRQVRMYGVSLSRRQATAGTGASTSFKPGASFLTNHYFIESDPTGVVAGSNGSTVDFTLEGIGGFNTDYIGVKNVGFLKYEADGLTGRRAIHVKDINLNYMWRGIHLVGLIWFGDFANITSTVSNTGFVGDAVIILEDGGHSNIFNPTPKGNTFRNTMCFHGDGLYNDFIRLQSGGYNLFDYAYIDGKFYVNAPITLNNTDTLHISNNVFRDMIELDMEAPSPDTRKASLWMSGTNVYDNQFINSKLPNNPKAVRIDSTGVYRNEIQLVARWGTSNIIVDDTGGGESNLIVVRPGNRITAGENTIVHTGGVSRVEDKRKGALNSGAAVISDGGTITHGLMTTPLWALVGSRIAGEFASVTARSTTTLTVAIKKWTGGTLTAGTASQTVDWRAGVYA
jgi:hypothetical protein